MPEPTLPPDPVELTVVVPTHNRADVIEETLAALATQEWDGTWDILLVDNDSTDETPQILEQWIDKMPVPTRIITATERHNASYSRNAAVEHTSATSVAFIDDDDLIGAGWVTAIGTALRAHQLVGSRFEYHHLNEVDVARSRTFQTKELGSFYNATVVSGGGMACRRELWTALDGSNESFPTGQDIDLSLRIARMGTVTPHFCADATYHVRLRDGIRPAFEQGKSFGRAWVHLHQAHGSTFGASRGEERYWLRRWLALALRAKNVRSGSQRLSWAFDVGHQYGRLGGSLTYRTWCP